MQTALIVLAGLLGIAIVTHLVFPLAHRRSFGRLPDLRWGFRWKRFGAEWANCDERDRCENRYKTIGEFARRGEFDYLSRHGACVACGIRTCYRTSYIEDGTLRRRVGFVCWADQFRNRGTNWKQSQNDLAQQRRLNDLERVTVPAQSDHVRFSEMPDQYPGPVRDAIRVMLDSEATEAIVDGIGAQRLNESLAVTGLHDRLYAEQRGKETVLRRIEHG